MLLELPQNIYTASTELLFPPERPIGIISPAKNGILVYGVNGKLAGQSFLIDKNQMRVSIADGGSFDVKKEGRTITVCPSPLVGAQKVNKTEFFVFGDPESFQYKLYVKKEGVVAPEEIAVVAEHLFKDGYCYVKINDNAENVFRALLICLSVNQL